ncbi:hypothetical protein [Bosea robiniae]|uniref:Uncharacterized protein n=1 Tax=Bosea robiniae TaxID=1036780 RepID=A0ABY0P400_9HYPH|nr:hypothetical protein [Bosea robiniae]SDH20032.1 hypothetical protein SAMN05421844_107141 [Bosea robiniae]
MATEKFLSTINDPNTAITPIDTAIRFPEILDMLAERYKDDIALFIKMIAEAKSSAELLDRIRQRGIPADQRMSLLKMFRRCVSPVLDTETTKKLKITTLSLVENYGTTFKPIDVLKKQFAELSADAKAALAALIGEYDTRGASGYILTDLFFNWFEERFKDVLTIEGPRGAGRDIELNTIFKDFPGQYPCDFVIRKADTQEVLAVGFARYDSTRGGAQSDDRTGGNAYKVAKAKEYCDKSGDQLRLLFLADGPGLGHKDTWFEACDLDGQWDGNVRVTTMKLADVRVTQDWLMRVASS